MLAGGAAYIVNGNVNFTAKWGGAKKIYISDNGDDANDGMTATTAVKHFTRANALLAEYADANTFVVVDTFTSHKDKEGWSPVDNVGLNGKTVVITGADDNAVISFAAGNDARIAFDGDVIFRNITIKGSAGDGRTQAQGHKIVFENTVKNQVSFNPSNGISIGRSTIVAGSGNTKTTEIVIDGGEFSRVYGGDSEITSPVSPT